MQVFCRKKNEKVLKQSKYFFFNSIFTAILYPENSFIRLLLNPEKLGVLICIYVYFINDVIIVPEYFLRSSAKINSLKIVLGNSKIILEVLRWISENSCQDDIKLV